MIHFYSIFLPTAVSTMWSLLVTYLNQYFVSIFHFPVRATNPVQFTLPNLITPITLDKDKSYELQNFTFTDESSTLVLWKREKPTTYVSHFGLTESLSRNTDFGSQVWDGRLLPFHIKHFRKVSLSGFNDSAKQ